MQSLPSPQKNRLAGIRRVDWGIENCFSIRDSDAVNAWARAALRLKEHKPRTTANRAVSRGAMQEEERS